MSYKTLVVIKIVLPNTRSAAFRHSMEYYKDMLQTVLTVQLSVYSTPYW